MCLLFCIVYFISYFMLNIMVQISSQQGAKSRLRYIYSLFCISAQFQTIWLASGSFLSFILLISRALV